MSADNRDMSLGIVPFLEIGAADGDGGPFGRVAANIGWRRARWPNHDAGAERDHPRHAQPKAEVGLTTRHRLSRILGRTDGTRWTSKRLNRQIRGRFVNRSNRLTFVRTSSPKKGPDYG